jgi:hypothetical protein
MSDRTIFASFWGRRFSAFVTGDGAIIVARDDGWTLMWERGDVREIANDVFHSVAADGDDAIDSVLRRAEGAWRSPTEAGCRPSKDMGLLEFA